MGVPLPNIIAECAE